MTNPPVTIVVDISGAIAALSETLAASTDLSPVLAGPVNDSVDEMFRAEFDRESVVNGPKWAPLQPVTVQLRRRRGHGRGGILNDTSRLWASLTKRGLGPDAVIAVTPTSLLRGTLLPYAKYHQQGYQPKTFVVIGKNGQPIALRSSRQRPRVPARPIIPDPVPEGLKVRWEKMIADWITSGGKRAE